MTLEAVCRWHDNSQWLHFESVVRSNNLYGQTTQACGREVILLLPYTFQIPHKEFHLRNHFLVSRIVTD